MLLHLTPKLYNRTSRKTKLIDINIEELNLSLKAGQDVTIGKPLPNKRITVARRKMGNKHMSGILLYLPTLPEYNVTTRWLIDAELVVSHVVTYYMLDNQFDTASEDMILWGKSRDWGNRTPEIMEDCLPVHYQPRMDVLFHKKSRRGDVVDVIGDHNIILRRTESFPLPTIEKKRLESRSAVTCRIPQLDTAFRYA